MLNETAIEHKIKEDTYFVICTKDLERKWTMSELIGIYKKQSVVERHFRCLKDKKLLINAIYLELPFKDQCSDVDNVYCSFDIYSYRIPDVH